SWRGQEHLLSILKEGDCFGEMAIMDLGPRSASVRAVEDCTAIQLSSTDLYQLCTLDLKQFSLIQMNMGREVCRRLREADNRLFRARMGMPEADIEHVLLGKRTQGWRLPDSWWGSMVFVSAVSNEAEFASASPPACPLLALSGHRCRR